MVLALIINSEIASRETAAAQRRSNYPNMEVLGPKYSTCKRSRALTVEATKLEYDCRPTSNLGNKDIQKRSSQAQIPTFWSLFNTIMFGCLDPPCRLMPCFLLVPGFVVRNLHPRKGVWYAPTGKAPKRPTLLTWGLPSANMTQNHTRHGF